MLSLAQKAIMRTIIYADIFDYPLTRDEIGKWLIVSNNKVQITKDKIEEIKLIKEKDGYFFLNGRHKLVNTRKEREKYSLEKLKIAKEITSILKFIPTIKLVGLTGALAVNNTVENDDIDLLVITSSGLLWTTRFLVTLLVEISGRRRHPMERKVNDKICLNMFVDTDNLEIPQKEQDLFSAHEVVQMKLLWDKDETYRKFIYSNKWVKKFLPNAIKSIKYKVSSIKYTNKSLFHCFIVSLLNYVEVLFKNTQLWYMRKRRTSEVIKEGMIRFHPQDARMWIVKKYIEQIKLFR